MDTRKIYVRAGELIEIRIIEGGSEAPKTAEEWKNQLRPSCFLVTFRHQYIEVNDPGVSIKRAGHYLRRIF